MSGLLTGLVGICLALAALYASVTLVNLAVFRRPRKDGGPLLPVSIPDPRAGTRP